LYNRISAIKILFAAGLIFTLISCGETKTQSTPATRQEALKTLKAVKDKYASCAFYSDIGFVAPEGIFTKTRFKTAFKRPDRLWLEYEVMVSTKLAVNLAVVWDGAKALTASPANQLVWPGKSLNLALAGAGGISRAVTYNIPPLLLPSLGGSTVLDMVSPYVSGSENIRGKNCKIIKGKSKGGLKTTVYIRTEDLAVVRIISGSNRGKDTYEFKPKFELPENVKIKMPQWKQAKSYEELFSRSSNFSNDFANLVERHRTAEEKQADLIIEKVRDVYSKCDSYADNGISICVSRWFGTTDKEVVKFSTFYARPEKIRFIFNKNERVTIVALYDGKRAYYVAPSKKIASYEKEADLGLLIAGCTGLAGLPAWVIPDLLEPKHREGSSILDPHYAFRAKEVLDGQECYVLEGIDRFKAKIRIYIRTDNYLIIKVEQHEKTREVTVTYRPEINKPVDENQFRIGFEPKYVKNSLEFIREVYHPKK